MRNKPAKIYLLIGKDGEPYRVGGVLKVFNSQGKAIKRAKRLYERSALLYRVTKCELVPREELA